MYLHIKHNVIIVKGALRAAIYDNNCELIYSINRDALKIIQNATEGIDINRHKEFLEYLVSQEIATWEDTFFDIRQSYPHILENKRESTTPLNFLWLEITGRCNLQCVHCYADSSSSFNTATELDIEEWKKIIDNAYKLGTTSVQFIGGEPLLRRDLLELIHFTLRQGYDDIEIFTNGVLITNTFLEKI